MRRCAIAAAAALLAGATVFAQPDLLARIRDEALTRSQVLAYFSALTDDIGPRLTGTPAYKRSAEWARDRIQEIGLSNAHLEPWRFGRGWVLDLYERVSETDLRQNAIVMAWFAWQAANTDQPIPRPEPAASGR